MAAIISSLGAEGYGVWWIILETIAGQMDSSDKCSVKYSAKKWGALCGFSPKKFQKVSEKLAEISSISVEVLKNSSGNPENVLEIECRNLLKYRDEYSKKSGQTPGTVRRKIIDTEVDTEVEEEGELKQEGVGASLGEVGQPPNETVLDVLKKTHLTVCGLNSLPPLNLFREILKTGKTVREIEQVYEFHGGDKQPYRQRNIVEELKGIRDGTNQNKPHAPAPPPPAQNPNLPTKEQVNRVRAAHGLEAI